MTRAAVSGLDLVVRARWVEASLWRRLRSGAEEDCRGLLFDRYVGLARAIARRHFRRRSATRIDRADFEQFAYEGLLQAIDRYDPLRGVPFGAYAVRRIVGNIADGIARMSEVDAQISHRHRIEQERLHSLRNDAANGPDDALAALSDAAVGLAIGLMLESLTGAADAADPAPNAYESLQWREVQARLAREVERLPEREATIIRHHYDNGLPFARIAELLELSRGRVSQLHRSALERLRKKVGAFV